MPTDLDLDDEIDAATNLSGTATGWATRQNNFVRRFRSNDPQNPFGSAAKLEAGTAAGNVLLLDENGRAPNSTLPNPLAIPGTGTIGSGDNEQWTFDNQSNIVSLNRLYSALGWLSLPDKVTIGNKTNVDISMSGAFAVNEIEAGTDPEYHVYNLPSEEAHIRMYRKYIIRIANTATPRLVASSEVLTPIDGGEIDVTWNFTDRSSITRTVDLSGDYAIGFQRRISGNSAEPVDYYVLSVEGINSDFVTAQQADNLSLALRSDVQLPPDASETVAGIIRTASLAQARAGTDNATAITPLLLKDAVDRIPQASTTEFGLVRFATSAELATGASPDPLTITNRVMSPATAATFIQNRTTAELSAIRTIVDLSGTAAADQRRTATYSLPINTALPLLPWTEYQALRVVLVYITAPSGSPPSQRVSARYIERSFSTYALQDRAGRHYFGTDPAGPYLNLAISGALYQVSLVAGNAVSGGEGLVFESITLTR